MADDGVREIHGVTASNPTIREVTLREMGDNVEIDLRGNTCCYVSAARARHLGLKFLRLARRIEHRAQEAA